MTATDILQTIGDFRKAAANAHLAGFDGVEIHAANGYLIDQFLQSKSNVRTDDYGGTTANRVRFLREVVEAVLDVWESTRVGVRISPGGTFNDMAAEDPERTFSQVVDMLNDFHLGYLHVVEAAQRETPAHEQMTRLFKYLRGAWKGIYIVNGATMPYGASSPSPAVMPMLWLRADCSSRIRICQNACAIGGRSMPPIPRPSTVALQPVI